MPTRQGWTVACGAIAAFAIGRVFGIIELFVIGAGLALAVALSVLAVRLHRPHLHVNRWVHPPVLTVGDTGRVDLLIEHSGSWRSPRVDLTEPVGTANSAHMTIAPIQPRDEITAGYRIPAQRRGVLTVGPTIIERRDLLGLASDVRIATGPSDVTVAPQTFDLPMPSLGSGVLGRHLLAIAQRIGPGEFHSLRDYAAGDEPRTIHWRASARSDDLKVRQHEAQGVRRCVVILDRDRDAYPDPGDDEQVDVFERAIVAAGSLVLSADREGLTTRFVTSGLDLRGPEVSTQTLRLLAPIDLGAPLDDYERDPGEGLGLLIVVTSSPFTDAWRRTDRVGDPTLTRVGVFTGDPADTRMSVDASSLDSFRSGWHHLAGSRGGLSGVTRPSTVAS